MTRPFSPAQKFRILVRFDAQIIIDGHLVPVSQYAYGTMNDHRRFKMLRRDLNCAVRCACGCDTWAMLRDVDFDHVKEHVSGGLTAISNGAPLRRQPCHAAKSARAAAVTGKVTRCRRKLRTKPTQGEGSNHLQDRQGRSLSLSVTAGMSENDSPPARTSRRSWPTRPFPKSSRPIPSRPFQKRWEPRT